MASPKDFKGPTFREFAVAMFQNPLVFTTDS